MPRTAKTPRYDAFNSAPNAFGSFSTSPSLWREYLDDKKLLTLELGCGKAEITLGLAHKYSDENFIGIDLKADRLWRASKEALEQKLTNAAFVQANILEIAEYFEPNSVDVIWITFPDPYPKKRQAKHRMLNRNFLDIYKGLLTNKGLVHFKTDNQDLFEWALELLSSQKDIAIHTISFDTEQIHPDDDVQIITTFERRFREEGINTKYVVFGFTS